MHTEPDLIPTPITADLLRGALELERTDHGWLPHRLTARARKQIPDENLASAEAQPSGVRLVFRTRATAIELDVLPTKMQYPGAPPRPAGLYDLRIDGRLVAQASTEVGNIRSIDLVTGAGTTTAGPSSTLRFADLPADEKNVEIWLPYNEITELIALRGDAPIEAAPDHGRRVWLHHGSSISHGSNAASASTIWPAIAARRGGVELVNLGFSGCALLDPFTARAIRDTPADLISVKIGINLTNLDLMRRRAFGPAVHGFLDTIRDGHPTTPLLLVSALYCPIHENTPGPALMELGELGAGKLSFRATGDPDDPTRLTLTIIRAELARIAAERAEDDPNLRYLDGLALYGEQDHDELPLPDLLHPDAATHRRIGERFADLAFTAGGSFG